MKLSTRVGIAIFSAVCVMMLAGSAWAWGSFSRHETKAYIYTGDNKTHYSGEYAPIFFGIRPSVVETSESEMESGNGIFTVFLPAGASVGWINESERYYPVEPEQYFKVEKRFFIEKRSDWHRVAGEKYGNDAYRDDDYYTYFMTNAEDVIPRSKFSVTVEGVEFFKDKPFAPLRTTQQQIDAGCVPYIELVTSGGNLTALKWRFVDPAEPDVPLVRGPNSNIASIWDFTIWTEEYYHRHEQDFELFPKEGDPLEGRLVLDEPYPLDEVGRVSVNFTYDLNINDLSDGFVGSYYSWRFEFKESEPEQEPEEPEVEADDDSAWDLETGIEVVAKLPVLADVTDADTGKPLPDKMAAEDTDKNTITTMPVFSVSVANNSIAHMSVTVNNLNSIAGEGYKVRDLTLLKLKKDGELVEFERVADPQQIGDGEFAVTAQYARDKSLEPDAAIVRNTAYVFRFGVKDNGDYDWDGREGKVVDPAAIAAKLTESGSGGSSGCNTGLGLFGLLLAGLVTRTYRKA
jgi:hypothetical protein